MRVGLNLVFLVPGETGGMETYARGLIPRLHAAGVDPICFVNRETEGEDLRAETVVVPVRAANRLQWVLGEQLYVPRLARRAGCRLVHSLASTAPLRGRFAQVVTIHDLHYRTVPQAHFGLRARGMAALVPAAAKRADRIIAVSQATRLELVSLLGIPAERIDVVAHGADLPDTSPTAPAELRERLGLGARPVVLTTGGTRPHKNIRRLVDAMAGLDAVLVVTGYATPEDATLDGPGVVRTGQLSQADLEGLYALAEVVSYPSLAEGFGLPVLEAMARGVAVACSAGGALEEVAGPAAVLFDPRSTDAIREAVGGLLGDAAERERRAALGRARAASFTWERAAEATADVYRRAVGER